MEMYKIQWEQETGALIREVSFPVKEVLKSIAHWAEGEKGVGRVVWEAEVRHHLALKDADNQGQGRGIRIVKDLMEYFKDLEFYANNIKES